MFSKESILSGIGGERLDERGGGGGGGEEEVVGGLVLLCDKIEIRST